MDNQNTKTKEIEIDFHQAAVVNEKGEEIAITEEMVQKACSELDEEVCSESKK